MRNMPLGFTAKYVQNHNRYRYNSTLLKHDILWTCNVLLCLKIFPFIWNVSMWITSTNNSNINWCRYVYVNITFSNIGKNMWMIHLKHKNKEGRQQINYMYDSFIHFTLTILIHVKLAVGNNWPELCLISKWGNVINLDFNFIEIHNIQNILHICNTMDIYW